MQSGAREKDKAGAVIESLVLKKCCDDVDRRYLMTELIKAAESSKPGTGMIKYFFIFYF